MADVPFHVDQDGDRVRIGYGQSLMFVRLADLPELVERLGDLLPEPRLVGRLDEAAK